MKLCLFICFIAFLLLNSCHDFYFKNPQPLHGKELKFIPDELVGTYLEITDEDSLNQNNKDTFKITYSTGPLVITRNSYDLKSSGHALEENKLSGTLEPGKVVLKKMDDFYVLSQKVQNPLNNKRDSVWEVYILEYKNNLLSLYSLASEDRELKVDSVKEITPVKEQKEGNEKYYLINPSNKQFKKLLINNLYGKVGEFKKVK